MKVLSLFDGMSCGMLAFRRLGIEVERYVAYEIDKYAIQVSTHNFPMIEQRGDVFEADFTEFEGFDFVVGGSPCTYWSIAQTKNRETEAHGIGWELFQQYVRAIREAKPKYFIYENNKSMSQAIREEITESFGFEPICINSALVSAQNRQRLYWVGIRNEDGTYRQAPIEQPEDRGILLKDVLDGMVDRDKSRAIIGSIARTTHREYFQKNQGQIVLEPVGETVDGKSCAIKAQYGKNSVANFLTNGKHNATGVAEPIRVGAMPRPNGEQSTSQGFRVYSVDGKSVALKGNAGGAGGKTGLYSVPYAGRVVGRRINDDGVREDYNKDIPIVQRFEVNENPEKTNCITTVQKDNMVAVPVNETVDGKAQCLRATCYKDGIRNIVGNDVDRKTGVAIPVNEETEDKIQFLGSLYDQHSRWGVFDKEGKSPTLTASMGMGGGHVPMFPEKTEEMGDCQKNPTTDKQIYEVKDGMITIKGKQYPIKLSDGYYIIRKLTVDECKRLQTVPDDYDMSVISNTQAYKCLGNGWTIEVIAHLIDGALVSSCL